MGMILTAGGADLLGKALAGKRLNFSRVIVGDGQLGTRNPVNLTDLVNRKLALSITALSTSATGTAQITAEITNRELKTGFFMREYGLFAYDPDTGNERMYSYVNKANEAGYIAGFDGTNPINYILTFVTVVDQAQNVTAVFSEGKSYVTPAMLDARIESLFADAGNTAGFWTYSRNDGKRFRPITTENARREIIGVTDVNAILGRLSALENALQQIMLAVNVQEIYPGAERFLAEDFAQPDTVDLYTAEVTSIVAGDDSIDCSPVEGLIPGSWYTITDGSSSEMVQVDSISLENGIMRVILTAPVKNTYKLSSCKIVRTTAAITTGSAQGSADIIPVSWSTGTTWSGRTSGGSYSPALDTSVSSSGNWNVTGSAVFNSDGFITLAA